MFAPTPIGSPNRKGSGQQRRSAVQLFVLRGGTKTMAGKPQTELPFRVGGFDTVTDADGAVDDLLAAGFTTDQITVVCSEESVKRHFARFEHQDPAGTETPGAAIAGGVCGAALGGLAAVAGAFTLGGAALLA